MSTILVCFGAGLVPGFGVDVELGCSVWLLVVSIGEDAGVVLVVLRRSAEDGGWSCDWILYSSCGSMVGCH